MSLLFGGGYFAGGALVVGPSIVDFLEYGGMGSADPHDFSTSGLSWETGQRVLSVAGTVSTGTVTPAGVTNDTASLIEDILITGARHYIHEITVNGGSLDATVRYDLDTSRHLRATLITVADVSTIVASPGDTGSSEGAPISPAFTVTGTKNRLLIATVHVRGGHDANPPLAPSGYTLLTQAATGTNESSTIQCTSAVAYKVALASSGEMAAATWQGLDDIGTQPWAAGHLALEPA